MGWWKLTAPVKDTIQASFKGVPFFVETETEASGRKLAIHEYPGADKRFAQDMGLAPPVFTIRGYVADIKVGGVVTSGWRQLQRKLTDALKEDTEGMLDMSVFGSVKVKAGTYSKTLDQTTIGKVSYVMIFYVTTPNPSPVIAPVNIQTVANKVTKVLQEIEVDVAEKLSVPEVAATTLVSAYDGDSLTTTIADRIARVGQVIDKITSKADFIRDNINDLIRDPIAYASSVFNTGLLGAIFDTVEASRDALEALSDLTRVGYNLAIDFQSIKDNLVSNAVKSFTIPVWGDDVNYRLTNNENRFVITNNMRVGLFAIQLKIAAENDYATDAEIDDVVADINDTYSNIILIDGVSPLVALALDQCRIAALDMLEDKEQVTPNVEDFELKIRTVDVELAYRLYAEKFADVESLEERASLLTDLNGVLPNRYVDDVLVLKL